MGVPARSGLAEARAGDMERTGGVPILGGVAPIELDKAAAKADTPGPAGAAVPPNTGPGLPPPFSESATGGVMARIGGCPTNPDVAGEDARRAVERTRGTEPEMEPWRLPEGAGDDDRGGMVSGPDG